MKRLTLILIFLVSSSLLAADKKPPSSSGPATMFMESTLPTLAPYIRQNAFDGKPDSMYVSKKNATTRDHLTLILDKPVRMKSVRVVTGRLRGDDTLTDGLIEVSGNGKSFSRLASFNKSGVAKESPTGLVKAIRIRPTKNLTGPLVIREIEIDADPAIAVFQHPVEFFVDTTEAPQLKEWGAKMARTCEQQYPMIVEELDSEGFKPLNMFTVNVKQEISGKASAVLRGSEITLVAKYIRASSNDYGLMTRSMVSSLVDYRNSDTPSWLRDGVAEYIRIYKLEPNKIRPVSVHIAKHDAGSEITAAFLAFVTEKYEPRIVKKINAALREGTYNEKLWKEYTGKTIQELERDWQNTLSK